MNETSNIGYLVKKYPFETKRYCQTLDLKDNSDLIEEYTKRHNKSNFWPQISENMRSVGILEMDIYLLDNRLFMIVETPLNFDWKEAFTKLATLPRQTDWENYMSQFQEVESGAASEDKWQLMERIFKIYE